MSAGRPWTVHLGGGLNFGGEGEGAMGHITVDGGGAGVLVKGALTAASVRFRMKCLRTGLTGIAVHGVSRCCCEWIGGLFRAIWPGRVGDYIAQQG